MEKKFSFFWSLFTIPSIILILVNNVNAQDYYIYFTGTGASNSITSVEVENLTSGTSLFLKGTDILHLTNTVGISLPEDANTHSLRIYPNPMKGISIFEFTPNVSGGAIIAVYDITGKRKIQIHSYLENKRQEFSLSGLTSGIYLLSVFGNGYGYTGKIVCESKNVECPRIEKIGSSLASQNANVAKKESNEIKATVDMPYSPKDKLKYTASSGIYSLIRADVPDRDKAISFNFLTSADGDSNIYKTVKIGSQIWFAENLKTTKYNDGTPIPFVPGYEEWAALTTDGYCWYNYAEYARENNYGALYNKYAVLTGKLCPQGWHVPKESEWFELINYLGGEVVTGGKIKDAGEGQWYSPNTGATNESGFSAVPSGNRRFYGSWDYGGNGAFWWSISDEDPSSAWAWAVEYNSASIYKYTYDDKASFTVRCVIGDAEPALSLATISVSKATDSTASVGGLIIDDGGASVTERGICWSTRQNPTISDMKTNEGSGPGTYKCNLDGLDLFTRYFVRAYAINSKGIAYGNEVSFISGIGMDYQGGVVAYILQPRDPGYIEGQVHGLIAAPSDQSDGIIWYNSPDSIKIKTSKELGAGNANTKAIVANQGEGMYAAKICFDLDLGGYSDWYLPSHEELNQLYFNREAIGGFVEAYYWSSSQESDGMVRVQTFYNGGQHGNYGYNQCNVRAVRSF
jgi:uncharacterized protein (TIGR02145 family)